MSKMSLLVYLNGYEDINNSNNPTLSIFKRDRQYTGMDVSEPNSNVKQLAPGETFDLFSGSVALHSDLTTTYDIAPETNSTVNYRISYNSGTAPLFRTPRISGSDATTTVSVTKNAKLITIASNTGTALSLIAGGVIVGDEVRLGSVFNVANQGKFKVVAVSATSLTIQNELGVNEGTVALGVGFSDMLNIYSSTGVQIGYKIEILSGFSLTTQGTYDIVDVSHDFIDIFSSSPLPIETNISNNPAAFIIYQHAKQFLYVESSSEIQLFLNDSATPNIIEPITLGTDLKPGLFLISSVIKKAQVINTNSTVATIYYITAE